MGRREEVVAQGGFQVSGAMTKALRHSFKHRQPAGDLLSEL